MSQHKRLERIETAVAERVAALKAELDQDPAGQERGRRKRALQAAEERARRIARAHQKLRELQQEKATRAERHAKAEAEKGEVKVSTSDPEARLMRLPDGAAAPAYNVQSLPRRRPGWRPATVSSSPPNRPTGATTPGWPLA